MNSGTCYSCTTSVSTGPVTSIGGVDKNAASCTVTVTGNTANVVVTCATGYATVAITGNANSAAACYSCTANSLPSGSSVTTLTGYDANAASCTGT